MKLRGDAWKGYALIHEGLVKTVKAAKRMEVGELPDDDPDLIALLTPIHKYFHEKGLIIT